MEQAVILAAGEGQRLRPFTVHRPKAMLAIADKPIVQYAIEALARNGIRHIVLVVGYRKEQVFDYFGSGKPLGVDLVYATQEKQLGTAHALAQARDMVTGQFLVLHGDNLVDAATVAPLLAVSPMAMLVKRVDNPLRYGVVTVADGRLQDIAEKPMEARSGLVDTGMYLFNTDVFDFIEGELDVPAVLRRMMAGGRGITTVEIEGTWLDVVYPWDILSLNEITLRRRQASIGGVIEAGVAISGMVSVGRDTVVRPNSYLAGPVVIGENCQIGPNVCILPATSIGNNVVIAPFTEVSNSVVGDDVSIGPGSIIQDSVIDRGCVLKGQFTAASDTAEVQVDGEHHLVKVGAMLGEYCHLDSGVVAQPGVMVGNHSQVRPLKLISGRLPDRSLVL
ncbi:MAG: bifunctional sugar-1-phosphate nucleotidylyltransferase/acetyltransferase [Chloroflexota bacterium]